MLRALARASGGPSALASIASRCIATSASRLSLAAVEKLYKELEGKKARREGRRERRGVPGDPPPPAPRRRSCKLVCCVCHRPATVVRAGAALGEPRDGGGGGAGPRCVRPVPSSEGSEASPSLPARPPASSYASAHEQGGCQRKFQGLRGTPFAGPHHRCAATTPCAGTFWGVDSIKPGDVLDLDVDQMEGLLRATSTGAGNKVRAALAGAVPLVPWLQWSWS